MVFGTFYFIHKHSVFDALPTFFLPGKIGPPPKQQSPSLHIEFMQGEYFGFMQVA